MHAIIWNYLQANQTLEKSSDSYYLAGKVGRIQSCKNSSTQAAVAFFDLDSFKDLTFVPSSEQHILWKQAGKYVY